MLPDPFAPTALLISSDLLFAGKIQAAAEPLGIRVRQETELPAIQRVLSEQSVCIVFLDLNLSSLSITDLRACLSGETRPQLVAYGPHVNTVRLDEARTAGCDRVMPRSKFHAELAMMLRESLLENRRGPQ